MSNTKTPTPRPGSNAERAREKSTELRNAATAKQKRQARLTVIGVVLSAIAALVIVAVAVQASQGTAGDPNATPANTTDTYGVLVGDPAAPVEVVIYEDFMCPACAAFEQTHSDTIQQMLQAGDVTVEYRGMSFLDSQSTDRYSTRALNAMAVVADLAGADAAAEFHTMAYQSQPTEGGAGLDNQDLIEMAVAVGADEAQATEAIENLTYEQWVINATSQAAKDSVDATPTVIVDGETLKEPIGPEFPEAVAAALGK